MKFGFNSFLIVDKVSPIVMENLKRFDRQPWSDELLINIGEVIRYTVHKFIQEKNLFFADEENIISILLNRISISVSDYNPNEEPSSGADTPKTIQQHIDKCSNNKIIRISFREKLSLKEELQKFNNDWRKK